MKKGPALPLSGSLLLLRAATFRLGDRKVFPRTNWEWKVGAHWAVVGENGSGKSLFADALRGKLPLVKGELRYQFAPPPGLQTAEEAIGQVSFQDRRDCLTEQVLQSRWQSAEEEASRSVREFLSYERVLEINPFDVTPRKRPSRAAFEKRSADAVKALGIERLLTRRLLALSNGEMQKVQLARTLSQPVRLLILDEPFTGLDRASRARFGSELANLASASLAIMILSNRPRELPSFISHCLELDKCRIGWSGTRREWLRKRNNINAPEKNDPGKKEPASRNARDPRKPLVRMRRVSVRYGDNLVLDSIDWEIRRGESWALLGPNGAGKTTLLSLIAGDHPQAWGNEIEVFGRKREAGEPVDFIKHRMGFVSPELHLHFDQHSTCMEAVASGLFETIGLFQELKRGELKKARLALRQLRLGHWAEKPLLELSTGWQRMVLLARALVKRPELLILDEPCQGLDRFHRALFQRSVERLLAAGAATVLYVTHHEEEIPRGIARTLRLDRGRIVGRL